MKQSDYIKKHAKEMRAIRIGKKIYVVEKWFLKEKRINDLKHYGQAAVIIAAYIGCLVVYETL